MSMKIPHKTVFAESSMYANLTLSVPRGKKVDSVKTPHKIGSREVSKYANFTSTPRGKEVVYEETRFREKGKTRIFKDKKRTIFFPF